jgi:hypothetical protein
MDFPRKEDADLVVPSKVGGRCAEGDQLLDWSFRGILGRMHPVPAACRA